MRSSQRSAQLVRWTPDTEIRSRNEFTDCGYTKDYDAVVTLRSDGNERTFALEYEGTAKARKEYLRIRSDIEAETALARFLYLVPNYDLLPISAASSRPQGGLSTSACSRISSSTCLRCPCAAPSQVPCPACATCSGPGSRMPAKAGPRGLPGYWRVFSSHCGVEAGS